LKFKSGYVKYLPTIGLFAGVALAFPTLVVKSLPTKGKKNKLAVHQPGGKGKTEKTLSVNSCLT